MAIISITGPMLGWRGWLAIVNFRVVDWHSRKLYIVPDLARFQKLCVWLILNPYILYPIVHAPCLILSVSAWFLPKTSCLLIFVTLWAIVS